MARGPDPLRGRGAWGGGSVPPVPVDPADHAAREAVARADPATVRDVMGARPVPVARRRFFSDSPDKWLFLVFAGGGFATTFAEKYTGFTGLPSAAVTLAVLLGYALVASRVEWFRLHPDRLGDNCYYMGFLFTLASLSAALVRIDSQTGAARDALLDGLIGSFGIALFSTIGGITLRVFFMQGRREVEDVEEVIRNDLQDAASRLKDQLGEAIQHMEGFRIRTSQVMDEQLAGAAEAFTAASKALADQVAGSGGAHAAASERMAVGAERAASELVRAVETIAGQMERASSAHRAATERLAANSGQVADEVRRLVERVDQVDIPSDLLTRQVDVAREQIVALVSTLEQTARHDATRQAATERAAESLDRLLQRMANLPAFDGVEVSMQRLGAGVNAAAAAMQAVSERMGAHAASIAGMVADAQRERAAMATARSGIEADLAGSTGSLRQLQGSLVEVAEGLAKRLGG